MLWTHAQAAKLYRNLAIMLASRLRDADRKLADLAEQQAGNIALARVTDQQ